MKISLLLIGLFGILSLSGCRSMVADDTSPFPTLSPSRVEQLWNDPAKAGVEDLFAASTTAEEGDDFERAVFFLWCGKVRLLYEASIFPPKSTGGNSPVLAFSAVAHAMGMTAVPMLYAAPESHRKVVDQFQNYVPELSRFYRPPWKYEYQAGEDESQRLARDMVAAMVEHSEQIFKLTEIPEYLESLKVYADARDDSPDRGNRFRAANAVMVRIEEETGIQSGLAYKGPGLFLQQTAPLIFDEPPPSDTEPGAQLDRPDNGQHQAPR